MRCRIWLVLVTLVLTTTGVAGVQRGEVVAQELSAAAQDARATVDVEATLLLPEGEIAARAVIVVLRWGLGASVYDDPAWRQLAKSLHCGLLGLVVRNHNGPADPQNLAVPEQAVRNASIGGAEALLKVLEEFARQARRPELRDAKILIWGHSAAGSFGVTFAATQPSRTIAFVRYHSHSRGLPVDMKTIAHIPALIFAGGKDTTAGVEDSETLWKAGRSVDAPWTFALEPDATHGSPEVLKKSTRAGNPLGALRDRSTTERQRQGLADTQRRFRVQPIFREFERRLASRRSQRQGLECSDWCPSMRFSDSYQTIPAA